MVTNKLLRRLRSDVPVTSRIDWHTYQEHLTIRDLKIEVFEPKLNVAVTNTVVEFTVTGTLSPHPRWRPFIKMMHISERLIEDSGRVGDILLVPIVKIRCDKRYDNKDVEFKVRVQHLISSYQWDLNTYRVTCGQFTQVFNLIQYNKGGFV